MTATRTSSDRPVTHHGVLTPVSDRGDRLRRPTAVAVALLLLLMVGCTSSPTTLPAESGDTEAAAGFDPAEKWLRIARDYRFGRKWRDKDPKKMEKYYRKAIEAGSGKAAWELGALYVSGTGGIKRDQATARELFSEGARLGDGEATYRYGLALLHGFGGTRSVADGIARIEVAWNEHGIPSAAYWLGLIYWEGEVGYPRDRKRAVRLLEAAATANDPVPGAMARVGALYRSGDHMDKDVDRARDLLDFCTEYYDHHGCPLEYGRLLLEHDNEPERAAWAFYQAVERGSGRAAVHLADLYRRGVGVERDYAKARSYYERALKLGYLVAFYYYGTFELQRADSAASAARGLALIHAATSVPGIDVKAAKDWTELRSRIEAPLLRKARARSRALHQQYNTE